MTSLTAIFGNSPDKPEQDESENEKLLRLFKNRAELKKEFARLRQEKYELGDRIKEAQGEAARLQQKLDHMENLLLDPEWSYSIITYFQLRGLNLRCEARVAKFAEHLKQQREQKQQGQLVDEWNQRRAQEAQEVERQIGEQRLEVQLMEDRLQSERHQLATMGAIMKIFRGRSLARSLDELEADIDAKQHQEQVLLQQYDEVQNREPPDTQGLDIMAKRSINFLILSFAQELFLHYEEDDVAVLAKEAGEKSLGAVNYGGKDSSDAILAMIKKRKASFEGEANFADNLQRRARLIAENARFRSEDEAVPTSASVSTVYDFRPNGDVRKSQNDLIGENFWNLTNIVSR